MMHAIGQLVIHAGMPEQVQQLDKIAGPLDERRLDAELASFGYNYADVGAELARRWKFPEVFSNTIAAIPSPEEDGLAAVVHLAAWRARVDENKLGSEVIATIYPTDVADSLGLEDNALIDEMPPLDELSAGLDELIK
jgi:HD-like signal output (HDOD) protein